jgi:hypothetical protein
MTLRETLDTLREQARESTGCLQEGLFFLVYFYYYPTSGDRTPIRVSEIKGVPLDHAGGTSIHLVLRRVIDEGRITPGTHEVEEKAAAFLNQILPLTLTSWILCRRA